jgi:hypothetical protein
LKQIVLEERELKFVKIKGWVLFKREIITTKQG